MRMALSIWLIELIYNWQSCRSTVFLIITVLALIANNNMKMNYYFRPILVFSYNPHCFINLVKGKNWILAKNCRNKLHLFLCDLARANNCSQLLAGCITWLWWHSDALPLLWLIWFNWLTGYHTQILNCLGDDHKNQL